MKRYIIGTIFGFVLATAVGANAQEVNKVIDAIVQGVFPVTVEGNSVGDAIVVNDKTYLPVREFGEAVGYKVTFTEDREVVLTKNADTTTTPVPASSPSPTTNQTSIPKDDLIESLQSKLRISKLALADAEKDIKGSSTNKVDLQRQIDFYTKQISEIESQLATIQAQK